MKYKVIRSLTKAQQAAMDKMRKNPNDWHTAYDLQVGMNTLYALCTRELVEVRAGLGSMFCPTTNIKFKLK